MEIILHDGQEFALGCMPRSAAVGSVRPCLAEAMTLIPKDKWEPCDFSDLVPPVPSQGSHGSCVGHQCTDAVQTARVIAGMPSVALSPWDLYSQICGGRDGGANIHDALSVLQGRGVSTLAACPDYTLHAKDAARDADAKKHQTTESFDCPDRPSIATAVQLRFPTPRGIRILCLVLCPLLLITLIVILGPFIESFRLAVVSLTNEQPALAAAPAPPPLDAAHDIWTEFTKQTVAEGDFSTWSHAL